MNTVIPAKAGIQNTNTIGSQVIRQIILPEIEKEINEGKNFATLRQIFYAQVLAVWFKRNLKQALLNQVYANKGTVKGIERPFSTVIPAKAGIQPMDDNEAIYRQYLRAYKKGVFNFIKEDIDPVTQETLPRKYFSGGWDGKDMAQAIVPVKFSTGDAGDFAQKASNYVNFAVVAETDEAQAAALDRNVNGALGIEEFKKSVISKSVEILDDGVVFSVNSFEFTPILLSDLIGIHDLRVAEYHPPSIFYNRFLKGNEKMVSGHNYIISVGEVRYQPQGISLPIRELQKGQFWVNEKRNITYAKDGGRIIITTDQTATPTRIESIHASDAAMTNKVLKRLALFFWKIA